MTAFPKFFNVTHLKVCMPKLTKPLSFTSKVFIVISLVASISGCATHIPVNREVGSLNFKHSVAGQSTSTGKVIAIVSPQIITTEQVEAKSTDVMFQLMAFQNGPRYRFQNTYQDRYSSRLTDAMMSSIEEIISKRGFASKGPYKTFDDIPFGDKKTIYLTATPSLKVFFEQKHQELVCRGMVCKDEGVFTVTGELVYKMIEPLTSQALVTKRINLSDFSITKSYIKEFQNRTQSEGLIGAAFDKAMNPEQLRDNTDRVMTEALNEFFQKSMDKIDAFVSSEELLSFESDINQLKGLKRF